VSGPPIRRWELHRANLNPIVGREQAGAARPVLVVSNDGFNRAADVVTVVPLTRQAGKTRKVYPYEILIPEGAAGNPIASILMPHQIRTISKQRLLDRMGILTDPVLQEEIENLLLEHLGIDFAPDV
jgi:mRNA interferase MazF